ncbi:pentatricopeptide repeat-containing protein At4g20740 isoform X2 [Aristolochia californica]|uniref:pentatricopeptide repeat-containing protein At4g20740 isoform X2 n=1 Tax=Aristolochia californica TaxID=171875 RepID=UPI0035DCC6D6
MPPQQPALPKPYFFYGHRRPSQNRPVVRGGFFSNRQTLNPDLPVVPLPVGPVPDLHKWDPDCPSPPEPTPSPSEAFFAIARRLSPVARFIVDSFRRNQKWGPLLIADLNKLRRVTPALVAEVLKVESNPVMASKFFQWADEIVELMRLQGKPPSEKQFEILIRMHSDANRGLRVFYVYEKMKKFGIVPRVFLFNRIMDALIKTNHLDLALSVYDDFKKNSLREESVTYMILVKGLCKAGRIDDVFEVLEKMRSNLCKPDVFAYTAMIRVLIAAGNLVGCLRVWREMVQDGVKPDVMAYTTLVTALCQGNEVDNGFKFFKEMKEKGFLIDRAVYASLIDSLVANKRLGQACDLLKDMTVEGYRADLSIYNSLMRGLCSDNKLEKAYKLFKITVKEGLAPEFETVNPLLVSYAEHGRMNDFIGLLDQMAKLGRNVMDDLAKFFYFMVEKRQREWKALEVFQELKGKGYYTVSIYNVVISGLHKIGEVTKALTLFEELKGLDLKPDSCTYSNVILCLVDSGDIKEACSCYNKIKEMAGIPSIPAYRSLVRGLCMAGEIKPAIMLVRDCLGNVTMGPIEFKYTLTILHFCKVGVAEKFIEVLEEMVEQGIEIDVTICCSIIYGFSKYRTLEEARKVFSLMKERKLLTEANAIVYDDLLVEHLKKTTAGLVLSALKFHGLESKWRKSIGDSKEQCGSES